MTTKRFDTLCATTISASNFYGTTLSATNLSAGSISATNISASSLQVSGDTYHYGTLYQYGAIRKPVDAGQLFFTNEEYNVSLKNTNADWVPGDDNWQNLGEENYRWGTGYITNIYTTNIYPTTVSGTNAYVTTVSATTVSADILSADNVYASIISGASASIGTDEQFRIINSGNQDSLLHVRSSGDLNSMVAVTTPGTGFAGVYLADSGESAEQWEMACWRNAFYGRYWTVSDRVQGFDRLMINDGTGTFGGSAAMFFASDAVIDSWLKAQFNIVGTTDTDQMLAIGYDTVDNRGVIQAGYGGVGYEPLWLNPWGSYVYAGAVTDAPVSLYAKNGLVVLGTGILSGTTFSGTNAYVTTLSATTLSAGDNAYVGILTATNITADDGISATVSIRGNQGAHNAVVGTIEFFNTEPTEAGSAIAKIEALVQDNFNNQGRLRFSTAKKEGDFNTSTLTIHDTGLVGVNWEGVSYSSPKMIVSGGPIQLTQTSDSIGSHGNDLLLFGTPPAASPWVMRRNTSDALLFDGNDGSWREYFKLTLGSGLWYYGALSGVNAYLTTLSATTVSADTFSGGSSYLTSLSAVEVCAHNISAEHQFHMLSGDSRMRLGFTNTATATKVGRMSVQHYDIDEEDLYVFGAASVAADNFIAFGGGNATYNAATQLDFYAGDTPTTTAGTSILKVRSNGTISKAITATGIVQLSADAVVWDDLQIPGLLMGFGASAPDAVTLCGAVQARAFDGVSTTEQAFLAVQLPHRYKNGTDLHPHVHWCKSSDASGDVVWALEYTLAISGSQYPSTTTLSAIGGEGNSGFVHDLMDLGEIDGTGLNQSTMIMCRLFRPHSDDNDTYEADAILLACDFHYQVDGFGSDQEYSKSY